MHPFISILMEPTNTKPTKFLKAPFVGISWPLLFSHPFFLFSYSNFFTTSSLYYKFQLTKLSKLKNLINLVKNIQFDLNIFFKNDL